MQDNIYVYAKEYFHPFNPSPKKSKPLIVVGPSGVGKRTLIEGILSSYGDLFERKKSYTTRGLREGEREGQSMFYFISKEQFQKMSEDKKFIECREKLQGNMYGTTREELERIEAMGKIPIIEVDV